MRMLVRAPASLPEKRNLFDPYDMPTAIELQIEAEAGGLFFALAEKAADALDSTGVIPK